MSGRINIRVSNQLWRPGVPIGGTVGQFIQKASGTDYDTEWVSGVTAAPHTIASHSDTDGTGPQLDDLTDGSNADSLHAHTTNDTHRTSTGVDHGYIDQDVTSGASATFDNTNFSGTIENTGNVSGAITIDIADGDYHQLTATGNITGITIDNEPTGSWGILIEATNWGAHTITLGSIEVPGGSITFTTAGVDILTLRGNGSNFSLSVSQADIS